MRFRIQKVILAFFQSETRARAQNLSLRCPRTLSLREERTQALDSPSHLRYDFRMLLHLLKDVWFYISAGGFLASLVLFVFLLGQYRLAVETEEENNASDENLESAEEAETPTPAHAEQFKIEPEAPMEEPSPALISTVSPSANETPKDDRPPTSTAASELPEENPKPSSQETPLHADAEIKIIGEGINKLAEQFNSLEKVFVAESRSNLKALEKISALLEYQTERLSQLNAAPPSANKIPEGAGEARPQASTATPLKEEAHAEKTSESPLNSVKKIKLKAPQAEDTIILKPGNEPQQLELSIKESPKEEPLATNEPSAEVKVEPAEEPAEKTKSPLKIKNPKDIDAIDEGNTLSTRKGPVWPI